MFLIFLLTLPIFADSTIQDTIYFHTSVTCNVLHKPVYHFEITFQEQDMNKEDTINRVQGTVLSGGVKNVVTSGFLENGDEDVNYSIYAKIRHDCTDETEEIIKTVYVTGQCKVGVVEVCYIYLAINLDGSIVTVHEVDQEPIDDY